MSCVMMLYSQLQNLSPFYPSLVGRSSFVLPSLILYSRRKGPRHVTLSEAKGLRRAAAGFSPALAAQVQVSVALLPHIVQVSFGRMTYAWKESSGLTLKLSRLAKGTKLSEGLFTVTKLLRIHLITVKGK